MKASFLWLFGTKQRMVSRQQTKLKVFFALRLLRGKSDRAGFGVRLYSDLLVFLLSLILAQNKTIFFQQVYFFDCKYSSIT